MSIPRQIVLDLVEGDDAPDLIVRFLGLDLRNYSQIEMKVEREDAVRFTRTVVPDLADFELGRVPWQPGDLVSGRHTAEFELIQEIDDKRLTLPRKYPIILNVRRDLG
jgi:hypothetical protein